jgi:hypothetical protein
MGTLPKIMINSFDSDFLTKTVSAISIPNTLFGIRIKIMIKRNLIYHTERRSSAGAVFLRSVERACYVFLSKQVFPDSLGTRRS